MTTDRTDFLFSVLSGFFSVIRVRFFYFSVPIKYNAG